MTAEQVDHVVVCMSRQVPAGAFVGVGLGTPSAMVASVLAAKLNGGHVLAGGAVDVELPIDRWFAGPDATRGHTSGYVSHFTSMEWAESQTMTLQFLRPAQIDGSGNLNTSRLGPVAAPDRRFPGGLATGDVTQLLPKIVAYLPTHQTRSTPEKVDFITGSGAATAASGYQSRGVAALVTDLGIIEWHDGSPVLTYAHPWTTPLDVAASTGFQINVAHTKVSLPPNEAERAALNEIDPHRLRDRELQRKT